MAVRGPGYAVSRIVSTLQTYLGTELDLIDAEEADGITLDDVANADYHKAELESGYLASYPAIVVNVESTTPIAITSTTNSPGTSHLDSAITVTVHVANAYNEDPENVKERALRYANAIVRVLVMKYPTLPSGGTETVVGVYQEGDRAYITEEQGEGTYVRTATIPLRVQQYETL